MPTGKPDFKLSQSGKNQSHPPNKSEQFHYITLENVLNLPFRKILNLEIDDFNFSLNIVEKKLQQSASIIINTSGYIDEKIFKLNNKNR